MQYLAGGDPVPYIHGGKQVGVFIGCGTEKYPKGLGADSAIVKAYDDALAHMRAGNSVLFNADLAALKTGKGPHSMVNYVNAMLAERTSATATSKVGAGTLGKAGDEDGCIIM